MPTLEPTKLTPGTIITHEAFECVTYTFAGQQCEFDVRFCPVCKKLGAFYRGMYIHKIEVSDSGEPDAVDWCYR
jgi:hypothetical protein